MKGTENNKEHTVVCLPSKYSNGELFGQLHLYRNSRGRLVYTRSMVSHSPVLFLYFLSDEDIKEGDYVISTYDKWTGTGQLKPQLGKIIEIRKDTYLIDSFNGDTDNRWNKGHSKKVIATTNPDLWDKYHTKINRQVEVIIECGIVPKIPTSFIEAFVREQGKIDKVLLEYNQVISSKANCPNRNCMGGVITRNGQTGKLCKYCNPIEKYTLKLEPNGSVIVHPYKEKTYTHSEVSKILILAKTYAEATSFPPNEEIVKWFNKHYPQH